jgi:hypothetical protein
MGPVCDRHVKSSAGDLTCVFVHDTHVTTCDVTYFLQPTPPLLGSVLLSEARMRYSRDSAIVTTGRYEFWSSNAIWNRIGVGGRRRSRGPRVGEGKED